MINKVILIGRIGTDLDLRYSNQGVAFLSFSLATYKKYKKDGEYKTDTQWHRLIAFNKSAELIHQYCSKGDQLYIEGELNTNVKEKDGIKQYITNVVIKSFNFLTTKEKEDKEDKEDTKSTGKKTSTKSVSKNLSHENSAMVEDVFGSFDQGDDFNHEELPF